MTWLSKSLLIAVGLLLGALLVDQWRDLRKENKQLREILVGISQAQDRSQEVLGKLAESQETLAAQSRKNLGAIYALGKQSKEVQAYLKQLVPEPIGGASGVLNSARTRTPAPSNIDEELSSAAGGGVPR